VRNGRGLSTARGLRPCSAGRNAPVRVSSSPARGSLLTQGPEKRTPRNLFLPARVHRVIDSGGGETTVTFCFVALAPLRVPAPAHSASCKAAAAFGRPTLRSLLRSTFQYCSGAYAQIVFKASRPFELRFGYTNSPRIATTWSPSVCLSVFSGHAAVARSGVCTHFARVLAFRLCLEKQFQTASNVWLQLNGRKKERP